MLSRTVMDPPATPAAAAAAAPLASGAPDSGEAAPPRCGSFSAGTAFNHHEFLAQINTLTLNPEMQALMGGIAVMLSTAMGHRAQMVNQQVQHLSSPLLAGRDG